MDLTKVVTPRQRLVMKLVGLPGGPAVLLPEWNQGARIDQDVVKISGCSDPIAGALELVQRMVHPGMASRERLEYTS